MQPISFIAFSQSLYFLQPFLSKLVFREPYRAYGGNFYRFHPYKLHRKSFHGLMRWAAVNESVVPVGLVHRRNDTRGFSR